MKTFFYYPLYYLDYPWILLLLLAYTGLFAWLGLRFGDRRWFRVLLHLLTAAVVMGLISLALLLRRWGEQRVVHLIPARLLVAYFRFGDPEDLRTVVINVLVFVPLGVWGCLTGRRPAPSAGMACGVSCFLELGQFLLACGETDLEDVVVNTLGALLGWLLILLWQRLLCRLYSRVQGDAKEIINNPKEQRTRQFLSRYSQDNKAEDEGTEE